MESTVFNRKIDSAYEMISDIDVNEDNIRTVRDLLTEFIKICDSDINTDKPEEIRIAKMDNFLDKLYQFSGE